MTVDEKIIALENAQGAVEAAKTAIVTMSDATDKAILQGTAHNHPTRPEIWANINGAIEILKRVQLMTTKFNNWLGAHSGQPTPPPISPAPAAGPQATTAGAGPAQVSPQPGVTYLTAEIPVVTPTPTPAPAPVPVPVPVSPSLWSAPSWQTIAIAVLGIGWMLQAAGWSPWRIATAPWHAGEAEVRAMEAKIQGIEAKHEAAIGTAAANATMKALAAHNETVEDDLEQIAGKVDAITSQVVSAITTSGRQSAATSLPNATPPAQAVPDQSKTINDLADALRKARRYNARFIRAWRASVAADGTMTDLRSLVDTMNNLANEIETGKSDLSAAKAMPVSQPHFGSVVSPNSLSPLARIATDYCASLGLKFALVAERVRDGSLKTNADVQASFDAHRQPFITTLGSVVAEHCDSVGNITLADDLAAKFAAVAQVLDAGN